MVFRAERVVLGMVKDTAYGTDPTVSTLTIWPEIVQSVDGLFDDIDWMDVRARGGDREAYQFVEAKHVNDGTINGILQTGRWIAMAMGKDVVTGAGPYTHTITPKLGMPFPTWSLEADYIDATTTSIYVKGMAADSLRLTGAEEDVVNFSASIKAQASKKNTGALSSVTPVTTAPFKFYQGTLTYFGAALARAVDFEWVYNNKGKTIYPYDTTANFGKYPREYIPGPTRYELRTTVIPIDSTFYDTLLTAATNLACTIKLSRNDTNDYLQIANTNCVLKSAPHPIPEEGDVRVPLELIPRNCTVTIVNSDSTSYADTS